MGVVFVDFLNLSVCCLPVEIWVCSSSEKNENDNSEGHDSAYALFFLFTENIEK